MANIKVVTRNNTLYISGNAYPDGSNITASASGNNISIYDSNNSKYIVKNHPYTGLVDASGTALAATAAATATLISGYINSSNPEGNIKSTDKITALTGLSSSDFASGKANNFVYATGVNDGISTTDKIRLTQSGEIILNDNVTVQGNIAVSGTVDNVDVSALNTTVSGINSYPSVDAIKVGYISVTQAVDLDQMESDIAANNAKISYPSADSTKLAGIAAGAEVNVNADWNATAGDALILNKPTIPTATSQLTNDSGFVTSAGITDVVQDTTPQLGGNLDLNGNNITGTGSINTTGIISNNLGYVTTGGITVGSITNNGSLSATSGTFSGDITTSGVNFAGSGTTTLAPVSSGPAFPDDFEIRSNGNVTIVLDYDSNEAAQAFIVKNNAGTTIFQVDEDGISSGLFTSTTPTLATISNFEGTTTGTITVSNYDSSATYLVKLYNSSGTEQTAQTITDNSNGTWSITNGPILTGAYVTVQAWEFGKLVSAVATSNSFNITAAATQQRYWRLQITDSNKNPVASHVALGDFRLYTATGGGGTAYPSNMTSETTPTPYVVTKGYEYSSSYPAWKAFDGGGSSALSMWWSLGGSTAANNWIQIDLGSSIDFGSGECQITTSGGWTDCNYAVLYGSNTGNFTGEQREMAFFQNIDKAGEAGGTFTTYTESIT